MSISRLHIVTGTSVSSIQISNRNVPKRTRLCKHKLLFLKDRQKRRHSSSSTNLWITRINLLETLSRLKSYTKKGSLSKHAKESSGVEGQGERVYVRLYTVVCEVWLLASECLAIPDAATVDSKDPLGNVCVVKDDQLWFLEVNKNQRHL